MKKQGLVLLAFVMLTATGASRIVNNMTADYGAGRQAQNEPAQVPLPGGVSMIFVERTDGTDGGFQRMVTSMQANGLHFYQTPAAPQGLIAHDDVVLLKINAQWDQRGGTNTDLIRAVIQAVVDHPAGFTGEVIVADNGQGIGSLNWSNANSANRDQSTLDVIRHFQAGGHRVTGVLWDTFTGVRVNEFSAGDMRDGFVVENNIRSSGLEISYPKFTTEFGTMVSFREGIWNPAAGSYQRERLKVINMPVLKAHWTFQVTGAVKNYMGVPSNALSSRRPHNSVGTGGMGTLMAETRVPALNIMDMIWIGPDQGPRLNYADALQLNLIAASVDPVALDVWATRNVLMPEAANRRTVAWAAPMNPTGTAPGTFGFWLRLSMNELLHAGVPVTMDEAQMLVIDNS